MKKHKVIFLWLGLVAPELFAAVPQNMSPLPEGDRLIYGRVVEAFRRNQMNQLIDQRTLLEKKYPSSIHLDNAYFLSGQIQFNNGRYGEAMRDFNSVTDRFPKSNKRAGALLGLASSYDRLGLKAQSSRVLQALIREYPGSQESQRAWMQLQIGKKMERH